MTYEEALNNARLMHFAWRTLFLTTHSVRKSSNTTSAAISTSAAFFLNLFFSLLIGDLRLASRGEKDQQQPQPQCKPALDYGIMAIATLATYMSIAFLFKFASQAYI